MVVNVKEVETKEVDIVIELGHSVEPVGKQGHISGIRPRLPKG